MGLYQDLSVAGRRWLAARGKERPTTAAEREREQLRRWNSASASALRQAGAASTALVEIDAKALPWTDTGIDLAPGDEVSTFAAGRVVLSDPLDVWVGPQFQLWMRVGERGDAFNGAAATHSFAATAGGRLYLAGYFPGQWGDRAGRVSTSLRDYAGARGGLTVLVVRWKGPASAAVRALAATAVGPAQAECERLEQPLAVPPGWEHLWFLGQSRIFRQEHVDGRSCIACRTHGDVSILQRDAVLDLEPGTRVAWDWKVEALPSTLREDTMLSHDYLSVAVEFENGRDLTYTWSAALPEGTGYWCPLPTWKDREFHVVVRSGAEGLGRWLHEERDLFEDYRRLVGPPPRRVVRVWLIAVSLFQRLPGSALVAGLELRDAAGARHPVG